MKAYHDYLPKAWTEIVDRDEVLKDLFSEFSSEYEPVPPFLFQDFRGGNMERLRPVFALYGPQGLDLLARLEEIDGLTRSTAETRTQDGGVAYAGYFFVNAGTDEDMAAAAVRDYIKAMNQIYVSEFEEEPVLDMDAVIEFPDKRKSHEVEAELRQAWIDSVKMPGTEIHDDVGDWFSSLEYQDNCRELAELLWEPLYHISNDYFLSYYLLWPMLAEMTMENPFLPHYKLWCMGLTARFPSKDRVIVLQ